MRLSPKELYEVEPHVRVAGARAGVLLFILADAVFMASVLASGGYLNALNTMGQFKKAGEQAPAFLPGLLVASVLVLSGFCYYWWQQRVRATSGTGQRPLFLLAWVFMVVALVGQIWMSVTLGYSAPLHAYESVILLFAWLSSLHFLLTAMIGLLLFGRMMRGRLADHEYIAEVAGYWWYYIVIASLLTWLLILLIA